MRQQLWICEHIVETQCAGNSGQFGQNLVGNEGGGTRHTNMFSYVQTLKLKVYTKRHAETKFMAKFLAKECPLYDMETLEQG